jgi:HlyD family secretion protein
MTDLAASLRANVRSAARGAGAPSGKSPGPGPGRFLRDRLSSLLPFNSAGKSAAHQSIQRHLLVGAVLFGTVTFGIGGWAATTRLAGAVITNGFLVVDTSAKKVQHPTGGVVRELNVHEGDRVAEGQVLLRLDPTQALSQLMIVTKSLDELRAREARLEAELSDANEIVAPNDVTSRPSDLFSSASTALATEQKLFAMRRQARSGQKQQLRERIAQLQEEIKGLNGQVDAKNQETALNERELQGVTELWSKGLVSVSKVTALGRDKARLEGERSQLLGTVAQQREKIAETELQILQVDQEMRSEAAKDLADVYAKIAELAEKNAAAQDQFSRLDIRSPQSGAVHELKMHTIGGVINPGETIMEIVPEGDALKAEVKVSPQDIDKVQRGQDVMLRFSSFNWRTTPEIGGKVSLVSADLSQDQRTGTSYYVARITPNAQEVSKLTAAKLVPGMPVEVFVETEERTVLSYLVKPLYDQIARAFREK